MMDNDQILKLIEVEGNSFEGTHQGYKYFGRRHPNLLHWCRYVFLPNVDEITEDDSNQLIVHGGITWNGSKLPVDENPTPYATGVFLGFDCAHSSDWHFRGNTNFPYPPHETYREKSYVIWQLERLINQIVILEKKVNDE